VDRRVRPVTPRGWPTAVGVAMTALTLVAAAWPGPQGATALRSGASATASSGASVANFTAAINRLVELVGLAGGGILALVWARVALSWFSNDVTKKVQAKDRARDALVGTLLFVAAVSGMIYGLAHWVVTGS
jgi:hypothetical protein